MTDPTPHRATPEQWHRVLFMESLQSDAAAVDLASTVCELRARVEALEAQQQAQGADHARVAPLLWVLWNHQGSGSPVGQPIRKYLGMGQFQGMSKEQVETAKSWASTQFPVQPAEQQYQPPAAPEPDDSLVQSLARIIAL